MAGPVKKTAAAEAPRASRAVINRVMYLLIGLALGVLLESRVFTPLRTQGSSVLAAIGSSIQSGPKLVVDGGLTYDFGAFDPGSSQGNIVHHTFAIRNEGNVPLEIGKIKPSCGCTTAKLDRSSIPAGESAQLSVDLDLRNRFGPQNQAILIESNDVTRPNITVALAGTSIAQIQASPAVLELGRVAVGEKASGEFEVAAGDGIAFKVKGIRSAKDGLTGFFQEVSPGKRYRVAASLAPGQPAGEYRGSLALLTDRPNYQEVLLPVRAYVGPGGPVLIGDQPQLTGPALDGGTVDLASLRGKPVVVIFWASWCGFCKRELPHLREIYQKYHDEGLDVVGVNVDQETGKAKSGCQDLRLPWRNIHFAGGGPATGTKNPVSTQFGVSGIPAIYLMDADGKVLVSNAHSITFEEQLKKLLDKQS